VRVPAAGLGDLHRAALDLAVCRAADSSDGGVVVARVPPAWIQQTRDGGPLLRWVLLFASPERRDLLEAYALVKRVRKLVAGSRVGVTIHGVRRVGEAERAFRHVANACDRHLGSSPLSYGLLVDDLHVYRAIVSRRPIGLEHPQSRAARALRDVAELVLADARTPAGA
jgi:MinD-like ATPase involved in chromosome partitioning or flagellar assembly